MDQPQDDRRPSLAAGYALGVLALTHVLSLLDRKLPIILAEAIKQDLQLSDTQLGLVTGAMFAVVYATMGVPVAMLIDRGSRKRILAGAVFLWSVLTALGGFAQNFWQLGLTRMGVALGETTVSPAANSMIADLFAPRHRGRAIAIFFVGSHIGVIAGLALGGVINEMANWRVALMALGAPGVLLTLLILLTLKEPPRANARAAASGERPPGFLQVVSQLTRQPTLVHLFAGAILASLAGGGLTAFLPSHLIRTFHLGTGEVGFTYGLTLGLAGITGALLGGFVGDWLKQKAAWRALGLVAVGEALSVPCIALAVALHSYPAFLVLLFVAQACGTLSNAPTYATIQSLMKSNAHATGTALYLLCVGGIGLALGPVFAGMLSDSMAGKGPQAALQTALLILVIPKLWASVHFALSALSLRKRDGAAG